MPDLFGQKSDPNLAEYVWHLNMSGFRGSPMPPALKETDLARGVIPRAIFLDPIQDLLLREEGYCGTPRKLILEELRPLRYVDADVLQIESRQRRIDQSRYDKHPNDEEFYLTPDSQKPKLEANDAREVILSEAGIDILNHSYMEIIKPLKKPRIRSPNDQKAFLRSNISQPKYISPQRYGSYHNILSRAKDKAHVAACVEKCRQMIKLNSLSIKQTMLTYEKQRPKSITPKLIKGSSFLGRGRLDLRLGWLNAVDINEDVLGDVSELPMPQASVTAFNNIAQLPVLNETKRPTKTNTIKHESGPEREISNKGKPPENNTSAMPEIIKAENETIEIKGFEETSNAHRPAVTAESDFQLTNAPALSIQIEKRPSINISDTEIIMPQKHHSFPNTSITGGVDNKFNGTIGKESCINCSKIVYANERLTIDERVYHKNCFRCAHCDKIISLGNYAALNNLIYCKPHFKQLFAIKGNYTDGFQKYEVKYGREENTDNVSCASESLTGAGYGSSEEVSGPSPDTQAKEPIPDTISMDTSKEDAAALISPALTQDDNWIEEERRNLFAEWRSELQEQSPDSKVDTAKNDAPFEHPVVKKEGSKSETLPEISRVEKMIFEHSKKLITPQSIDKEDIIREKYKEPQNEAQNFDSEAKISNHSLNNCPPKVVASPEKTFSPSLSSVKSADVDSKKSNSLFKVLSRSFDLVSGKKTKSSDESIHKSKDDASLKQSIDKFNEYSKKSISHVSSISKIKNENESPMPSKCNAQTPLRSVDSINISIKSDSKEEQTKAIPEKIPQESTFNFDKMERPIEPIITLPPIKLSKNNEIGDKFIQGMKKNAESPFVSLSVKPPKEKFANVQIGSQSHRFMNAMDIQNIESAEKDSGVKLNESDNNKLALKLNNETKIIGFSTVSNLADAEHVVNPNLVINAPVIVSEAAKAEPAVNTTIAMDTPIVASKIEAKVNVPTKFSGSNTIDADISSPNSANLKAVPRVEPPLPPKDIITQSVSVEEELAKVQTIRLKEQKCKIQVQNFSLFCYENSIDKPLKHFFPLELRRIISVSQKESLAIVNVCISRKGGKDGGKLKKLKFNFEGVQTCTKWIGGISQLALGDLNIYQSKAILVLLEKSDKESQRLFEKYMKEVFEMSLRPVEVKVVQYNEFSMANSLSGCDMEKVGNIVLTNTDFVSRLQQVLVRERLCANPASIGMSKHILKVSGLDLQRAEGKLTGFLNKLKK